MKKIAIVVILAAVGLVALSVFNRGPAQPEASSLTVLCEQSLASPVGETASQYARELGVTINVLVAEQNLAASSNADLIVAADIPTLSLARSNNVIRELLPLVSASNGPSASIAVTAACQTPADALRFARYLTAPEKGGPILSHHGLVPVPGDPWKKKPKMILYSGGVNRPAVEDLLKQFAEREGIDLTTVFNGCGILCATMKAMTNTSNPQFPDAYYACDLCFVPPVANEFPEAVLLTETDIGIAVQKGNPKEIHSLADLAQPKLKVGLCNAEQSTLGYMTLRMLKTSSLLEAIQRNVAVEVPTADFLVNQMRTGALEAAIVYRVNWQLQSEHLDFVPLNNDWARAVQPFSVRGDSPNRQLAGRLLAFLRSQPDAFTEAGFLWRGEEPAIESKAIPIR